MAHEIVKTKFGTWRLAPLRPLDDFLLESARFQWPNTQIPGKWSNRIRKNLLYYQSNYFLSAIAILLCIFCIRPSVLLGLAAIGSSYWTYTMIQGTWTPKLRDDYPVVYKTLILFNVYFTYTLSANIPSLIFAVTLPIAFVLAHASFRLRNFNNKLANLEKDSKIATPMLSLLNTVEKMAGVARDRSTWEALVFRSDSKFPVQNPTDGRRDQ